MPLRCRAAAEAAASNTPSSSPAAAAAVPKYRWRERDRAREKRERERERGQKQCIISILHIITEKNQIEMKNTHLYNVVVLEYLNICAHQEGNFSTLCIYVCARHFITSLEETNPSQGSTQWHLGRVLFLGKGVVPYILCLDIYFLLYFCFETCIQLKI